MSKKLDEIEARGTVKASDARWLIGRIRKLETVLDAIKDYDRTDLDPEEAYGFALAMEHVGDLAREALKED